LASASGSESLSKIVTSLLRAALTITVFEREVADSGMIEIR
jgi:hypothetical protein